MKKILTKICTPFKKGYNRIKLEIQYRKKLKELKKRDPFIYK